MADITMYEDGPLLLRGSYRILDQDGNEHLVSSDLGSGRVIAFRISPDGTRIAVARKTGTTYAISVSPIDRGSSPAIELGLQVPFRPDAATLPTALTVDDVAWDDVVSALSPARIVAGHELTETLSRL